MSETCCSSKQSHKPLCPQCGHAGLAVDIRTIKHHLARPWDYELPGDWGACENASCELMYFSADDQISLNDIRERPAFKQPVKESLLCHCFGVYLEDFLTATPAQQNRIRLWVTEQTRQGLCACDIRNPAGRCCLKDFKSFQGKQGR